MLVKDLMSEIPATVMPQDSLQHALKLMAEHKHRHLVVVEENGLVVGIVSDRDLALVYDPENMTASKWEALTVRQVMSAEPVTIGSTAAVSDAARLLLKSAVSALPIVDNGQLVGVFSDRDFTRYFARQD